MKCMEIASAYQVGSRRERLARYRTQTAWVAGYDPGQDSPQDAQGHCLDSACHGAEVPPPQKGSLDAPLRLLSLFPFALAYQDETTLEMRLSYCKLELVSVQ
ncbi:MAG: hypothetical protein Kow0047_33120 [Anaerolineae bacterium]